MDHDFLRVNLFLYTKKKEKKTGRKIFSRISINKTNDKVLLLISLFHELIRS